MIQYFLKECRFKIKNGTLIRNRVRMRDGSFVTGFRYKHTTAVRIKRVSENIEKKISFTHKADAKRIAVLGP
ncbi:MAG TPA: hypothetical protein VFU05_15905 [Cyclobacteriaceae bacterium]|nr:hypothetical protein [Cyclobacteriaceae bacterium]